MRILLIGICNNSSGKLAGNFYHMLHLSVALKSKVGTNLLVVCDEFTSKYYIERLGPESVLIVRGAASSLFSRDIAVRKALNLFSPDVIHRPTGQLPFQRFRVPCVMTIPDVNWRILPTPTIKRIYKDLSYWLSISKATMITCVSESTKRDVEKYFPISNGKCVVVHHGTICYTHDIESHDLNKGRVYFVTFAHHAHKNAETAILGLSKVPGNTVLVVVGGSGKLLSQLRLLVSRLSLVHRVVFVQRVSEGVLRALYKEARALIFMSRFEGFGLPILEAMGCGCPVICSNATALPEVAGDAACILDPDDVSGIAREMIKLAGDERFRARLQSLGYIQSAKFTWEKAALQTLDVYYRAIGIWKREKP